MSIGLSPRYKLLHPNNICNGETAILETGSSDHGGTNNKYHQLVVKKHGEFFPITDDVVTKDPLTKHEVKSSFFYLGYPNLRGRIWRTLANLRF